MENRKERERKNSSKLERERELVVIERSFSSNFDYF